MATSYFPHQEEDQPKPRVIWDKVYGWVDSETGDPIPGGPDAPSPQGRILNTPPNAAGQTEPIDPRTTGGRMPPIPTNKSMVPDPRDTGFEPADPKVDPGGLAAGFARKALPYGGRILGPLGAYFGSTTPADTGEFHPNVRPDIALGGKPTGIPFPSGPGYGQGPFAGRPNQLAPGIGQGPFAGRPDATSLGSGIGQGPFAGRPDTAVGGPGIGQGPFAGRSDTVVGSPSGPAAAPVASPAAAASSAVAAQRPNLGYYMTDRPNMPAGQQGGRGGPSQTQMGMFGFDPKGSFLGRGGSPPLQGALAATPDLAQRVPLANTPTPPVMPPDVARRRTMLPNY